MRWGGGGERRGGELRGGEGRGTSSYGADRDLSLERSTVQKSPVVS